MIEQGVEGTNVTWSVEHKEWDSQFFRRQIASLTLERSDGSQLEFRKTREELLQICKESDIAGCDLLECHLDLREFPVAAALESVGFRLVDSRTRFLSEWSRSQIPDVALRQGAIAMAKDKHTARIIELTHQGFTDNDRFFSRFKNREYFTDAESRRYFEAWITNTINEPNSYSAVWVIDGRVVGYYIYQVRGTHEGLPLVKGILAAIEKDYRGANGLLVMQAYLYRRFDFEKWFLDNTTQLTNKTVIRNHIASNKYLEDIVLTFYRKQGGLD
jgi:hypothetical protein